MQLTKSVNGVTKEQIELGKIRRELEREADPYFLYMDNADRMAVLRGWYPQVFFSLKEYYDAVLKAPDNYPKIVQNAINAYIELRIPPGDYYVLKLR